MRTTTKNPIKLFFLASISIVPLLNTSPAHSASADTAFPAPNAPVLTNQEIMQLRQAKMKEDYEEHGKTPQKQVTFTQADFDKLVAEHEKSKSSPKIVQGGK